MDDSGWSKIYSLLVLCLVAVRPGIGQSPEIPSGLWRAPPPVTVKANDTGMFMPQSPTSVSYSDAEVTIDGVTRKGHPALRIVFRDARTQEVAMPPEVEQVDLIRRVGQNRVVVIGMNNGDLSDVTIVELSTGKIVDKFFCYLPSLSPSGRYIAFVKFYPTHPGIPVEDHYMLYDTAREPAENRPPNTSTADWMTVGVTLYPAQMQNSAFDNYRRADHSVACYSFIWAPDSRKLLFADRYHTSLSLIMVEIDPFSGPARSVALPVSTEKICPQRPNRVDCELNLASIDFTSPKSILVKFRGVGMDRRLTSEYKVSYSEFR